MWRELVKSLLWGSFYLLLACTTFLNCAFWASSLADGPEGDELVPLMFIIPITSFVWGSMMAVAWSWFGVPIFTLVVFVVKRVRKRLKAKREATGAYSQ